MTQTVPFILALAERFPAPDFHSGYTMPQAQVSPLPSAVWQGIDIVALLLALSVAAWIALKKRSRKWMVGLTVASVLYFGLWRKGCVCPVGSIQNVAFAAGGHGYALPWLLAAYFLLPLLFALFYGRVFCSGVCPLGAVQDLVLFKPIDVPRWIEAPLGLLAWAYLGLAVLFASIGSDFVICRYDPFVGFFRRSGAMHMIMLGGVFLAMSAFIGRVYCRFFCPYSVLLRILAPCSRRQVSITPTHCTDCRLCEKACPFGAIRYPSKKAPPPSRPLASLLAVPASVICFGFAGFFTSNAISHLDFNVRLAELVRQEESTGIRNTTEETKAFRGTGQTVDQLYASAATIQHRFAVGTPIFGAWMGLAIAGKLLSSSRQTRRNEYRADPASCLACARCFSWCPAESDPIQPRMQEELVMA